MDDKTFKNLVTESVKNIPKEFRELMENVDIIVQEWPNQLQLNSSFKRGGRGLLLGLYEGIPKTKRRHYGIGGAIPDKITIFKNPILMISRTSSEIKHIVKDTVIHEIAHHFGFSDEDLIKIKTENKKNKS